MIASGRSLRACVSAETRLSASDDLEARGGEKPPNGHADGRLVVDDQHLVARHVAHSCAGQRKEHADAAAALGAIRRDHFAGVLFDDALHDGQSRGPVPPSRCEKNGSKTRSKSSGAKPGPSSSTRHSTHCRPA